MFLVRDGLDSPVPVLVASINLLLQLVLRVAAGDVLHVQIRTQIFSLHHELDLHGLVIASLRIRRG